MIRDDFVFQAQPNRVVFGAASILKIKDEAQRLGITRAVVLSTQYQVDTAQSLTVHLGDVAAGICSRAVMHTPVDVTQAALDDLRALDANGIVSVGGGSTIGLGKALSVRTGLPHIAVPTTYAGSEMTPILGETENGIKTTRRDKAILPATTIYDVNLTMGLPQALSATSGMNAIAHSVEALYAPDGNPIIALMAEESIRSISRALRLVAQDPSDVEGRKLALYGAWLAGTCLGSVSMSIHHKLCHTLGGTFDLPHAETHTVILPYATAFVDGAAPEAMAAVRRALATEASAAAGLQKLALDIGAPTRLAEIGMDYAWLDRAAELAVANPYWAPRTLGRQEIRVLLGRAFTGEFLQ
jgi:alcohol dehydrogenase class IV